MKTQKITLIEKTREGVMKKILLLAAMTIVSSNGLTHATVGQSGGQFLRIGVGARGPGMGGAISPIVDDVSSIYYNPAGLSRMESREIQMSYNAYFKDTSSQFLGYAHPTEDHGTFGVGISMFGVRNIDKRSATAGDADAPDLGSFNTNDLAASLAWGNKLSLGSGRLRYGAALKYISSDLGAAKAVTAATDFGAMYDFRENGGLTVSLAVLNLGGELKFQNIGDPLPLNVKPGVAYRMNFERGGKLTAVLDSDLLVHDGLAYIQPGFEWSPYPMFSLRTGYQFARAAGAGSGFAAGAGFRLMNIGIDYAFVPFGDLGDTHRISLDYRFGPSSDSRSANADPASNRARVSGRSQLSDLH